MRIKRFNESEVIDISYDRVSEISSEMGDIKSSLVDHNRYLDSLLNEMNNYKSPNSRSNDQIDDTVSELQIIRSSIINILDKIDNINSNLLDYTKNGRKYIYTENK